MRKGEVRDAIFAGLLETFGTIGFTCRKADDTLERKFDGGRQVIVFALVDYNPTFIFTLFFGVRLDAIQDITNEFNGALAQDFARSVSSTTGMEYFMPSSDVRFRVKSIEEIQNKFTELRPEFEEKVLPFFASCITLEDIEHRVNSEKGFIYSSAPRAAFTGIAAAFLVRPDMFEQVVEQHLGAMRERGYVPSLLEPIERMVEKLRGALARKA